MQGIDATFGDVWFERGRNPDRVLNKIIPAAAALALAGSVGVAVLHTRTSVAPGVVNPPSARLAPAPTGSAAEATAKPYGEIVIDPSFLAEMKQGSPAANLSPLASLDAVPPAFPLPSLDAFPPEPSAGAPAETVPLPPAHESPKSARARLCRRLARPNLGRPAPERHFAQPNVAGR